MREFVKKIAEELKVGETNDEGDVIGQAAIVTFSEEGEKRITLAESRDAKKFYDLVDRMPGPLLGGRTKTHRGLKIADEEIAIKEAGYREDDPDVKKLLMVITDGEQTKESVQRGFVYVGDAMKPFFARNMDVFAIGVGLDNEDAIKEVKDMVEVPENAILAANFSDLLYRVESIIKKFCPGMDRQCNTMKNFETTKIQKLLGTYKNFSSQALSLERINGVIRDIDKFYLVHMGMLCLKNV